MKRIRLTAGCTLSHPGRVRSTSFSCPGTYTCVTGLDPAHYGPNMFTVVLEMDKLNRHTQTFRIVGNGRKDEGRHCDTSATLKQLPGDFKQFRLDFYPWVIFCSDLAHNFSIFSSSTASSPGACCPLLLVFLLAFGHRWWGGWQNIINIQN